MGCSSFRKYSYCFSEGASTGCSVGNCSDMVLSEEFWTAVFSEQNFRPWQSYRERRQASSPQSFGLFEWLHSTGPFFHLGSGVRAHIPEVQVRIQTCSPYLYVWVNNGHQEKKYGMAGMAGHIKFSWRPHLKWHRLQIEKKVLQEN